MEVFKDIIGLRQQLHTHRMKEQTIGLVPTMGYLHQGHIELITRSKQQTEITVCSIFVNPIQFNSKEDLDNYPKSEEKDLLLLEQLNVSYVFYPSVEVMYPSKAETSIRFKNMADILEGEWRPGHFVGVGLVVAKLLNIVQPDKTYFGQKDLQQLILVKKMVADLNINSEIVSVPIVREASGLALSSRNARLTDNQKEAASSIFKCLTAAKEEILKSGGVLAAKQIALKILNNEKEVLTEYVEIVSMDNFEIVDKYTVDNTAICVAASIGNVRLIDNVVV